mmetsp:Transcript_11259/g.16869  ORF Transcript_11259/g.16869 Transcript_11259/m.16869 type:complete len:223 (-) Transcript_11259:1107-1775(-)
MCSTLDLTRTTTTTTATARRLTMAKRVPTMPTIATAIVIMVVMMVLYIMSVWSLAELRHWSCYLHCSFGSDRCQCREGKKSIMSMMMMTSSTKMTILPLRQHPKRHQKNTCTVIILRILQYIACQCSCGYFPFPLAAMQLQLPMTSIDIDINTSSICICDQMDTTTAVMLHIMMMVRDVLIILMHVLIMEVCRVWMRLICIICPRGFIILRWMTRVVRRVAI